MASPVLQLLGSAIFPTIVGMAVVSFRRKPDQPAMPSFASGGLQLFLKAWVVTFICTLVFGYSLEALGISETYVSAIGHFALPAIAAYFFTRNALSRI